MRFILKLKIKRDSHDGHHYPYYFNILKVLYIKDFKNI